MHNYTLSWSAIGMEPWVRMVDQLILYTRKFVIYQRTKDELLP
jgi:hypothetical protein